MESMLLGRTGCSHLWLSPSHLLIATKLPLNSNSKFGYYTKKCRSNGVICKHEQQVQSESSGGSRGPLDLLRLLNAIPEWADDVKERGMQQRRALYTHDDWLRHRSSKRHMRHLLSSLSSRVILSLIPPACIVTAISVVIATYNTAVFYGWLPSFMPLLHSSSLPYELTAPALALLLVFRTEASYSRYDEGRKTWTKVISSTKDFARQANAWIQHPTDTRCKADLLQYIMAFPVSLKCHIIHGTDVEQDLGSLLEKDDLAVVLNSEHRPNCIVQFISASLRQMNLDDSKRDILDCHISQFNESVSICERLIRTPIPLSYTRLTSRFLVLWHLALPIILWDQCQWMVIPATLFSASSLFCIEEVGVLIEEPFAMLALDKMCAIAHDNIREMVKLQNVIEDHLHEKKKRFWDRGVSNGVSRKTRVPNFMN